MIIEIFESAAAVLDWIIGRTIQACTDVKPGQVYIPVQRKGKTNNPFMDDACRAAMYLVVIEVKQEWVRAHPRGFLSTHYEFYYQGDKTVDMPIDWLLASYRKLGEDEREETITRIDKRIKPYKALTCDMIAYYLIDLEIGKDPGFIRVHKDGRIWEKGDEEDLRETL